MTPPSTTRRGLATTIVNQLLAVGADAAATNKDGQTPLDLAIKHGKSGVVKAINDHMKKELAAVAKARRETSCWAAPA